MFQMKEQDKKPEVQLSELVVGNLPEKEFRIMIVKMIQDPGKGMEAQTEKIQEIPNKELDDIKNNQLNNGIMKMKNAPEGIGE